MQVQEIMTRDPACCGRTDTIRDAAKIMAEKSVGSVPVLNDAGEPVGIVTDRDICCGAVAEGKGSDTPVSEVMSTDILATRPDEDVSSCCDKMEERQVRRAVVTDDSGKCCGMGRPGGHHAGRRQWRDRGTGAGDFAAGAQVGLLLTPWRGAWSPCLQSHGGNGQAGFQPSSAGTGSRGAAT